MCGLHRKQEVEVFPQWTQTGKQMARTMDSANPGCINQQFPYVGKVK